MNLIGYVRRGLVVALAAVSLGGMQPAHAAPWFGRGEFVHPAFHEVWTASDRPVALGEAARSYTWGPQPWFDYKEYNRQSPNGLRQVQYFDKARMELNNPLEDTARGVTNGLLTVEMVSGRLKLGEGTGPDQNDQRHSADVPVAGDPLDANPDAPTYASFRDVATLDNGYRDLVRTGERVGDTIDKFGNRLSSDILT